MAYDSITLSFLVKELKSTVTGGKITKINQPERDEITLTIFAPLGTTKLIMSANPSINRLHTTEHSKENPLTPPNFCMLLRKHIAGSTITDISQMPFERVVDFSLITKNELGYSLKKHLIFELTGKTANIILTDENYIIYDTLKHLPHDIDTDRILLPGSKYDFFPPRDKIKPNDEAAIRKLLSNTSSDIFDLLSNELLGVSPLTLKEMLYGADRYERSEQNINRILCGIKSYLDAEIKANIVYEGNEPKEVLPFWYNTRKGKKEFYPSLLTAHDEFYRQKDNALRLRQKSKTIATAIKNAISRTEKKTAIQKQDILDCKNMETYKQYGELILANIHAIKAGSDKITLNNFYEEDYPQVTLQLNPQLTPQQNAQDYFKKYRKMKNTLEHAQKQLEHNLNQLEYLYTIRDNLSFCETESDFTEIYLELVQAGIIKESKGANKSNQQSKPLKFSIMGYTVLAGKNNIQNDKLVKNARPNDIWLHTNAFHSSHVIIENPYDSIPFDVILYAAEIAAYYSAARQGDKIAVDYTRCKNVKKPAGAKPGFVTYKEHSQILVTPNAHNDKLV